MKLIQINLLPDNLKASAAKSARGIEPRQILSFLPFILAALIALHILLGLAGVIKGIQVSAANNKWQKLTGQRKIVEDFKKEHNILSADSQLTRNLVSQRISWSEKLSSLSRDLPSGIWFGELALNQKSFILDCSAVSLQKKEMSLISQFMDKIKKDTGFFKDFTGVELGTIQRKNISGYDIVDFVITLTTK